MLPGVTELLPAPLIGKFASLAKFISENVIPLAGLSGGFVQGIKDSLPYSNHPPAPVPLASTVTHTREPSISSHAATHALALDDPKVVEELRKQITAFLFAESIDGISADAQILMRKPRSISWCTPSISWPDIDSVPPLLSKIIAEDDTTASNNRKWTIDTFHAESDHMVGDRGRLWFDDCWIPDRTSTATIHSNSSQTAQPSLPTGYEYRSYVVPETDHDFLMDPAFGASEKWLQRVRESFPPPAEV
ncbi:hypothetical protein N0V83_000627 [Neocucurbitaria cava]|uniref:Uncharacterized protein n=1 Tax=Neocucurbitaria cava TaxID=798079 RepID=A0A9W9CS72_9PLEO|nr:hypothetical protein N0V83_000627 [Neocucurbitaria cava]